MLEFVAGFVTGFLGCIGTIWLSVHVAVKKLHRKRFFS